MGKKLHIKSGDTVKVIAGDSKGKTGVVKKVLVAENKAIIEGLNIVKRHLKPSASAPSGSIVEKEAPIHISNLMFVDPATNQATRIGRKLNDKSKLARYSKKTNKFVK